MYLSTRSYASDSSSPISISILSTEIARLASLSAYPAGFRWVPLSYVSAVVVTRRLIDCVQCAYPPGTLYPTGTVRSFRNLAAMPVSTIRWPTTRCYEWPGRSEESRKYSRWSSTYTAGHTSSWCPTTTFLQSAGTERGRSRRFSTTVKTTRSPGSDSATRQRTSSSTTFCNKYDHSREVFQCRNYSIVARLRQSDLLHPSIRLQPPPLTSLTLRVCNWTYSF